MSKTWKELEAEGVSRCCACFVGGGQCRRRATSADRAWCAKHGPIMEREIAKLNAAIAAQLAADDSDDEVQP